MDLAKLDLEAASAEGIVVEILHPTETEMVEVDGKKRMQRKPLLSDGKPVTIRLFNTESAQFKAASKVRQQAFKGEKIDITSDEFKEASIDVLAECTISWEGIEWKGEPLKCTKKNARMLYSNGGLHWLVKDLMAATGDHSLIPLG